MLRVFEFVRQVLFVLTIVVFALVVLTWNPTIALANGTAKGAAVETTVVPADEWNDEVKLWLARSVVGEAGWRLFDEYSAIAWVYARRAKNSKRYNFLGMVKKYSAAIRWHGRARQPWLFELGFDARRPENWPSRVSAYGKTYGPQWDGRYKKAWQETLAWADEWQAGNWPTPCPGANHFGGPIDAHRAHAARWTRIKCQKRMRNRFYTSLRLVENRRG